MDELIGVIKIFAGTFMPRGYAACDGRLLPVSSNTALFSIIGTTYGGNGSTTFALPDLRSRVPVGIGEGPGLSFYEEGQMGGVEDNTLSTRNLPSHTHTAVLNASAANADISVPVSGSSIAVPGRVTGRDFNSSLGFNATTPNVQLNPASIQLGATGEATPVNNLQPYLGVMYIICTQGVYPSRE
jgi:microcystin-dependent protein